MNANKLPRRSYDDDPLPVGTIIRLRGSIRELESVSPGKLSPAEVAAELERERECEETESPPSAPETAVRQASPPPRG
jgi:hypothetical protein